MHNLPGIIDLQDCFDRQLDLLKNYYIKKQKDPEPGGDIGDRKYQAVLKRYIGYFIEELVECNMAYGECVAHLNSMDPGTINQDHWRKLNKAFNHELSDTFHFLLDLMIYSNISPESVEEYYKILLEDGNMGAFLFEGYTLKTAFIHARNTNLMIGNIPNRMSYNIYPRVLDREEAPAGTLIHVSNLKIQNDLSWACIVELQKASHWLKNRPWVQGHYDVDYQNFVRQIMKAWLAVFQYYDYVGLNETKLGEIYMEKNAINWERIKNKR